MGTADLKANSVVGSSEIRDQVGQYRRKIVVQKNAGAATVDIYGHATAPTLTATVTNQDTNQRAALRHATAATNGAVTGMISGVFTILRSQWNAEFSTQVTTDISGGSAFRCTAGLFSANPDTSNFLSGAAPATHFMGFQTDNPNSGGPGFFKWNWCCVTCDGLTVTRTYSTQFNIPDTFTGGTHKLRAVRGVFDKDGLPTSGVRFFINEIYLTTHWTALPTATLGYGIRQTATAAVANSFEWSRFEINHDG